MKVLLHACCAPCSVECLRVLGEEGLRPGLFWYNPNIHPFTEYRSRRDSLSALAKDQGLDLILEDEYGLRRFLAALGPGAPSGERCLFCYRMRLEKAALLAAREGYGAFSTTLLISPYQNHGLIKQLGEDLAARNGIAFLYRDFRPFFREGQRRAREQGYYMQKYCGCIFSEEERYLQKQ
ncbi:MAG: epoxyqueuosine reductase QueH [Treponema sp.]|jgi:predicted adenine nucleotide alpha hydrolase (AANH) superfamily ATPase|nr:epoxyqueuosine reductase QueH [Treponema sp.]